MTDQTGHMERLAVVILNWNGEGFLRRFLPGVVEHSRVVQGVEVEVVVADNGSDDRSVGYVESEYANAVRILRLDGNYGFTGGYNRAFEMLKGEYDYYLLLNSDVEVTPGWLDPLVRMMRGDKRVGAVMPKVRGYDNRDRFEYAGASGGFIDWFGFPFCRGRILGSVEEDRGQYDQPREVFWTTGAAMLMRAELYHELGGLDELFFAHMEEIDLCWRMKRAGWKCMVEPGSVVCHVGGGALPQGSPRKTYLNFRNNLAMLYKNLRGRTFAGVYSIRFLTDGVQWFGYALTGKWRFAGSVWRGHRDFWRMRSKLERNEEYGYIARSAENGIYRGLIALRYLLGKRTFGNLL